jgi:hypothetical protein
MLTGVCWWCCLNLSFLDLVSRGCLAQLRMNIEGERQFFYFPLKIEAWLKGLLHSNLLPWHVRCKIVNNLRHRRPDKGLNFEVEQK